MNSAFCCFSKDRSADGKDIERFWLLFEEAQKNKPDMEAVFDAVLKQYSIKITKLTMGLFYICPNKYMALDKNNREYLKKYGINVGSINKMNFIDYEALLDEVKEKMSNKEIVEQSIPEFSSVFHGQLLRSLLREHLLSVEPLQSGIGALSAFSYES